MIDRHACGRPLPITYLHAGCVPWLVWLVCGLCGVLQSSEVCSARTGTVARGGVDPVWTSAERWECRLRFHVCSGHGLVLLVTAMDEDVGSADDVIGVAELDVARFAKKHTGFCRENVRALHTVCAVLPSGVRVCATIDVRALPWPLTSHPPSVLLGRLSVPHVAWVVCV